MSKKIKRTGVQCIYLKLYYKGLLSNINRELSVHLRNLRSQILPCKKSFLILKKVGDGSLQYYLAKAFFWPDLTMSSGDGDLKSNGVIANKGPISLIFTSRICLLYEKAVWRLTAWRLHLFGG